VTGALLILKRRFESLIGLRDFPGFNLRTAMKKLCAVVMLFVFLKSVYGQNVIDPTKINIVRDTYGVPHIFAQTDAEVAYGLAWAHAEDDFSTIQKSFLACKSMLGQYNGRDGATIDYVVQLLRIRDLVYSRYETDISDDFKAVLQGYCDGFNSYAYTHQKEVLVKRGFPITPHDLVAYSVLQLAIGCGVDAALKKINNGTVATAFNQHEMEDAYGGSNAFAFNSRKTKDGSVYLAINTHHPLEGQVSWYEAHLSSQEGWNIVGALFPGAPVIFTGVNEHLAWTHTVNHPDRLDIYQLEVNPHNPLQYKVDNVWYTLEENTVKLKVKIPGINLHVKKKAYWSIYGPTMITDKGTFSIRTAGIMDIRGLEQWYRMNKSTHFSEFKKALEMEALPGYNLMYGDRYDTIYYLCNGKLPLRDPSFDWSKTLPGNTTKTLWTRTHPLKDLPQIMNPSSGYLYNTNHSPFNATAPEDNIHEQDYDPTMGYETLNNNRSERVMELMKQYDKIDFSDFKKIKYDVQLPEKLSFPVNIDTLFLLNQNENPEIGSLILALKRWDKKGTVDSKGAAVFAAVFYYVAGLYEKDESFASMSKAQCIEALRHVKNHFMNYFGRTDISLGEYQRLERGEWSVPLQGLPDVLAAMYSTPSENGRVKGTVGDCYIGLIRFTKQGPEIETVNCFGASNRKNSIHYDDQMELFQHQKAKKMSLDRQTVYAESETIYHPEIASRLLSAKLTRSRR
jgi:acyl-homoserine-lactone acylase